MNKPFINFICLVTIENYKKLWAVCGSKVNVVNLCGTDFGTQDSIFSTMSRLMPKIAGRT